MITSSHNPKIQQVRALIGRKGARDEARAFVVEGVRLVEEALASGWRPELVLYSRDVSERGRTVVAGFERQGVALEEVDPRIFDSFSDTETSQGLLAVLPQRALALPPDLNFVLVADQVRDPGNLGTLLRTAAAAGVQAILLAPGTADAYAPKVLRAGMGAHFRLPLASLEWDEIVKICKPRLNIYLAEAGAGTPCWQLDLRKPVALVVGGEADGASPAARQAADGLITIPMPGKSESLNAAVAASILLFEIVRQRNPE
jgi:TrmH family RNA methyltransferase